MAERITPQEALRMIHEENAVIVDVREVEEFAVRRIAGARLQPLSVMEYLPPDDDPDRPAIYFCNSGRRTGAAMERLDRRGHRKTYILDGGLEAWERARLPVEQSRGTLPLARQVHIAAGCLIVVFLLLGQKIPFFRLFAVFIGLGLLASGLTGFCGMAMFLEKMPWNKKKPGKG